MDGCEASVRRTLGHQLLNMVLLVARSMEIAQFHLLRLHGQRTLLFEIQGTSGAGIGMAPSQSASCQSVKYPQEM
jgi:hypothetical protein